MSIPTYEMKALNCRILVPMTMPEKEVEENVRFFENIRIIIYLQLKLVGLLMLLP